MATYRTDSVYRNTAIINNQYLDVLDVSNIDVENTATTSVKIDAKYDEKPDLLAYDLYVIQNYGGYLHYSIKTN